MGYGQSEKTINMGDEYICQPFGLSHIKWDAFFIIV